MDDLDDARLVYHTIGQNWAIAAAKLNGTDYHPALYDYTEVEAEEAPSPPASSIGHPSGLNLGDGWWNPAKGGSDPYECGARMQASLRWSPRYPIGLLLRDWHRFGVRQVTRRSTR